jgi:hypothetical protein
MARAPRNPWTASKFDTLLRSRLISPLDVVAIATAGLLALRRERVRGRKCP